MILLLKRSRLSAAEASEVAVRRLRAIFLLASVILAGCAASNDGSQPASQSSLRCADLTGSAYLECQKNVAPAASTGKSFKMVRTASPSGRVAVMDIGMDKASHNNDPQSSCLCPLRAPRIHSQSCVAQEAFPQPT